MSRAKFPLGLIVATPGALDSVSQPEILRFLSRHASADWSDLCDEDREANDRALLNGSRLLSAYRTNQGVKFWIITEHDRSSTTILLPEEY